MSYVFTLIEHLLTAVRKSGFMLLGKKCQFAKRSVNFSGHVTDQNSKQPQPEKLNIIPEWRTPRNPKKPNYKDLLEYVRSGGGVWGVSHKSQPPLMTCLENLIFAGHQNVTKHSGNWNNSCVHLLHWQCQPETDGFQLLVMHQIMKLGIIWNRQTRNGQKKPVAFGAGSSVNQECNYSTTEKKCLAVINLSSCVDPTF